MQDKKQEPILSARGIGLQRGGRWLFRDLNLDLHAGEFLAIVGPSGVGKTTLLSCLCGMLEPSEGSVSFKLSGTSAHKPEDLRSHFGIVYQELQLIPNADRISIPGRSRDGNTIIVANSGPKDPGTYWLIRNGRPTKISGRKPYLEADMLAPVDYVKYKARDGVDLTGYITVPKGPGPFPLVVLPHGGPYVPEVVDGFFEWAQMLANNGYMVLHPQYRGS